MQRSQETFETLSKQPLHLWWSMEWTGKKITHIVVKSNRYRNPVIKRYLIEGVSAEPEIDKANALIKDIAEGRLNIKDVK